MAVTTLRIKVKPNARDSSLVEAGDGTQSALEQELLGLVEEALADQSGEPISS